MDHVDLQTGGAPTEYRSVDISAVPSGSEAASEPQLMPTTTPQRDTTPEDLNFVSLSVESHGSEEKVGGEIGGGQTLSSEEMGSMNYETRHRQVKGKASQFLESKGFGWLMEVEEEDCEEENRPLLLV